MTTLATNSKCLAFHGPLLYEAKILKVHEKNKNYIIEKDGNEHPINANNFPEELHDQIAYFIHYKGWKSSWDEWVDEKRVLEWNFDNLRVQKELKSAALASTQQTQNNTHPPNSNKKRLLDGEDHSSTKKRRGVDPTLEKEEEFLRRPEISLTIPNRLKSLLVDDWEYVTKDHQLVSLPASITVKDIIDNYKRHSAPSRKNVSTESTILDEVLQGLELYFNRSLGVILLYRFERNQYLNVKKSYSHLKLSEIYGAEHLLRLFVSLPGLIAQTSMDQQSIGILKEYLEDFLRYMESKSNDLFSSTYENVTPAYDALSKAN